jgi:hypothetical protein
VWAYRRVGVGDDQALTLTGRAKVSEQVSPPVFLQGGRIALARLAEGAELAD